MKERIMTIARWGLLVWGALSLVGVITIAIYDGDAFPRPDGPDKIDSATNQDVRFVLNRCELGDHRIEKVVHSYVSPRSGSGDYLDAYSIKITHVERDELTKATGASPGRWYRGDQLPQVLDEAVEFFNEPFPELPWFPSELELRSPQFYVYPVSITLDGLQPTAVELVFIRPADKMVFYFGIRH